MTRALQAQQSLRIGGVGGSGQERRRTPSGVASRRHRLSPYARAAGATCRDGENDQARAPGLRLYERFIASSGAHRQRPETRRQPPAGLETVRANRQRSSPCIGGTPENEASHVVLFDMVMLLSTVYVVAGQLRSFGTWRLLASVSSSGGDFSGTLDPGTPLPLVVIDGRLFMDAMHPTLCIQRLLRVVGPQVEAPASSTRPRCAECKARPPGTSSGRLQ
jgi:hypothetical protein